MSFTRALQENPAPRSVGDVTLRYEAPVLIGETRRPPSRIRWLPELFLVGALVFGVAAIASLIAGPPDRVGLPAALGLGAGLCMVIAVQVDRLVRQRRRFVLHFADEVLRMDLPGGPRRGGTRHVVPFDAVHNVDVLERNDGRYALAVEFSPTEESGRTVEAILVEDVRQEEAAELQRLWTTLRAAFGIRATATPEA